MSKAEELAKALDDAYEVDERPMDKEVAAELRRLAAENEQMRNDLLAAKDALNLLERYEYAAATIALRIALSPTDH